MFGNSGGEMRIGTIMNRLGTRMRGVNYRLQQGEGPSLENIPAVNDNTLLGLADESIR
jgi:hypothetical protein